MTEQPRNISPETIRSQRTASDPARSAWVSANAGSGKTHVLASRVIRLLLAGIEPHRILCLTYTKSAAANMSARVFSMLGQWTHLDEEALRGQIEALEGNPPCKEKLDRARRLFAEALETPGGLKIQTIHGFCDALLHRFPLEASLAGHFELMDAAMEAGLIAEVRSGLLRTAYGGRGDGQTSLAASIETILTLSGEAGLDDLLDEITSRREELRRFLDAFADPPARRRLLARELSVDPDASPDAIAASVLPPSGFDRDRLDHLLSRANHHDAKRLIGVLSEAIEALSLHEPARQLAALHAALCTGKGEPYAQKGFVKAAFAKEEPDFYDRYSDAVTALSGAAEQIAALETITATEAVLDLAERFIARYDALKRARGLLDYTDLIARTLALLTRPGIGQWVQYKLDEGIDHLLIDEAQDTSPDQWAIVNSLVADFFAGEGARSDRGRTIFAVGDEKQSIYSFQGADPARFAESGTQFARLVKSGEKNFDHVRLYQSFRSTPDVLGAVDATFAAEELRRGVSQDGIAISHQAVRDGSAGHVEVWPYRMSETQEPPDEWMRGVDPGALGAVRLADDIAETLATWLRDGERLPGRNGRKIAADDILILVRKRDRFVHALSRRLKEKGVPVAGADRLSLPAHIAVQDLIALGRFVQQPQDDLSLAALLKSPLFGFSDDELMALAMRRPDEVSLWQRLRDRARDDGRLAEMTRQLRRLRDEIGYRRPAAFYGAVLGRDGGRAKLVGRLGPEAGEVIDEFMNFVVAQESAGVTDLETLLETLREGAPEIKREMDQGRGEVRIMTVHAAKGLEAPIVFLVDSGGKPSQHHFLPKLMEVPVASTATSAPAKAFLWRCSAIKPQPPLLAALSDEALTRQAEEYRRLLYVGMTRAEDRLIMCGYANAQTSDDCWLNLVQGALRSEGRCEEMPHPVPSGESDERKILRYRLTEPSAGSAPDASSEETKPATEPAPLFDPERRVAVPTPPPAPLSPSGLALVVEEASDAAPTSSDDRLAVSPVLGEGEPAAWPIVRGSAVHRLLELLPERAASERDAAAERWLSKSEVPEERRDEIRAAVFGVLNHPDFATIFAAPARAEVSISGRVLLGSAERAVSGVIDRLVVTDRDVLVVDYKTNAIAPRTIEEVQHGYILQLALYRALLQPLYPDRLVKCALLYTTAPRLIEIDDGRMALALRQLSEAIGSESGGGDENPLA